jgi:5-methylcytosine-specific restriction enzyme subunit McrC
LPSELHNFSCNFDEFLIDNPLNRVIKAALLKIQERSKNEENKKRSFNLYSLMHEIKDETISPSYKSKMHFNRLNEQFKDIIEFSFLILFGSTYSAEGGFHQYYALVFDMNLVFERYVTKLLRTSLPDYTFDYQNNLHLASEYLPSLHYSRTQKRVIPDIIGKENEKPIAIIDTKYKPNLSNGFISNADFYQMISYSIANESDTSILLYPKIRKEDSITEREHYVVLDKLITEKKCDRSVLISACALQLFDDKGRIRRRLTDADAEMIQNRIMKRGL